MAAAVGGHDFFNYRKHSVNKSVDSVLCLIVHCIRNG